LQIYNSARGESMIRARAYCSSANLGSGFDVIAVALNAYYDEVEVRVTKGGCGKVELESIEGPFAEYVDPKLNTSLAAAKELLSYIGVTDVDVSIRLWKGIPASAGLGGSGASAIATVKALTLALDVNLSHNELIKLAGKSEAIVAGEPHYDNVSASLLGGLVVVLSQEPINVIRFNISANFVIATPLITMPPNKTAIMRGVLPKYIKLKDVVYSHSRLAALVTGFLTGNLTLAGYGMEDNIVEPVRAPYIPCYEKVKRVAMLNGALGVAISGAGPSVIILCENEEVARKLVSVVGDAYKSCGLNALVRVAQPGPAAHIIDNS